MRRALAWVVAVPLVAAATVAAHALDYRLTVPDAGARTALLAATGHGDVTWVAFALALLSGAALVTLVADASELRRCPPTPARWPFLVLPALVFTLQEHLERLLHDGAVPLGAVAEPTFLPGLLLTIPFGVLAYVAARLLLHVARELALALGTPRARKLPFLPAGAFPRLAVARVRVPAAEHAPRGPPPR